MDIIKVIIVDDYVIFRKGLRAILNEIDEIKVVGEASNGHELFDLLKHTQTDVILMDIRMPVMDGVEATRQVVEKFPHTKVIALTMFEDISYFNQMVEAGADGFLLKKTNKDELQKAIKMVIIGETYFSEEFVANATRINKPKTIISTIELTEREQEVLELICKGQSNTEIAKYLGISPRTIDGHRSHLLEKSGAKNAPQLVLYAIKNGLIKA